MSENPDVIRADIEATRARLGTNVDAVADKVTPSHIVQRQTDKVKENVKDAVFGVKEKVMGAADHTAGNVHSATGSAARTGRRRCSHRATPPRRSRPRPRATRWRQV